MRTSRRLIGWILSVAVILVGAGVTSAQRLSYSSGQSVSPGYEGWEEAEDGQRYFLFGYMNRNWDEEPNIPVGADNRIEPNGPDQGQPTHFQPRRKRLAFRVPVPDDFNEDDEMVWTLSVNGVTERAYATLRPDYFVDDIIKASEHGAIGAGTTDPVIRANVAPTLTLDGATARTVRVGEPLRLVVSASDDGVPEPRRRAAQERSRARDANDQRRDGERRRFGDRRWLPHSRVTVSSETGLRGSGFVYRGAGNKVTFDPPQTKVWEDTRTGANSPWAPAWLTPLLPEDGQWITEVTFDEPGEYVLRCLASDGALGDEDDITVTVTS